MMKPKYKQNGVKHSLIFVVFVGLLIGTVAADESRKAGDRLVLKINDVEYAFRWCPAGKFMMGSPLDEVSHWEGFETLYQVTLTRGYWMLETTVTQSMWESVMGNNPSQFKGSKLPVEQVSWEDCQAYIQKLNDEFMSGGHKSSGSTGGLMPAALEGFKFALPTEAQWEYACRAGTTTPYYFGNTLTKEQANYRGNAGKTVEVGSYPANPWGLHEMHGNVSEWCADWFRAYPSESAADPVQQMSLYEPADSFRIIRGGSWRDVSEHCRSASRLLGMPSHGLNYIGLRLALVSCE